MDLLHHRRGFDDHPFNAEVGVFLYLFHHQGQLFRRDLGIQGHPDLPLVIGGNTHRFADLAVFHFPGAFAAAKAFGPHIHGVGAVFQNRFHHFQAAARS